MTAALFYYRSVKWVKKILSVELLAHTPEPDALVAAAAKLCYRDVAARELLNRETRELSASLINNIKASGHLSVLEHASFTFGIDGLSRVASHQLVRHRLASFSQQSQRNVRVDELAIITPPDINKNPAALEIFYKQANNALAAYKDLIALGVKQEDARFILPHGWATRLVLSMNARELLHFFSLRLCRRAQWEIRELARKMLALCLGAAPVIFADAGPECLRGDCREAKSCGRPFADTREILAD